MDDENKKDEPKVHAEDSSIAIGGISIGGDVDGEINIASGNIVKNINTFYERALTAAEEALRARQLERKLLADGVSQLTQSLFAQARQIENVTPYKGLLAYNLNEAEIFFGRNEAKKSLIKCINQDRLTVLHAESGAGKSSLLQAGIVAQLIANGHLAVRLRPHNTDPVEFIKRTFLPELSQAPNLRTASLHEFLRLVCGVLGPKVNIYLLLDQFEEFFDLFKKEERAAFLESLVNCLNDSSLKVNWVLALRAEALSDLAELESFGITPFKNAYRLNRLTRNEAQEAIIEPAKRYNITFEQALIDHILDSLVTNSEVTPTHLQLVCSALIDDLPADKTLTLAYYTDREGGTEGILRDYLKRQLEHLPSQEQSAAWKILRVLITADRHRAVKTYEEVVLELKLSGVEKEQIDIILPRLIERRLLTTQPTTVETFELAHDYLVKEINLDPQEQARKAAQELLDQEVRSYTRHKTLMTSERLSVIQPYRNELRFSPDAEILFKESLRAVRGEHLARRRRRRWAIAGIITALLAMIIILTGWIISSRRQNSQISAQKLYAQSLLGQDNFNARKLLLWAEKIGEIPEARFGLFMNYSPIRQRLQPASGGWIFSMDISPDQNLIASGRQDGSVNIWDANTLTIIQTLNGPNALVHHVEFSPKGDLLAASFEDPDANVYVWHMPEGKFLFKYPTKAHWVKSITFNSSQTLMAIGLDSYDQIKVLDITHPDRVFESVSISLTGRAASIAFSPRGDLLAAGLIGPSEKTLLLLDTTSWDAVCSFSESKGWIYSLAFNEAGTLLASGGKDPRVYLWDPYGCDLVGQLAGHEDAVQSVNFSVDGTTLVSGSFDTTIRLWNVQEQKEIGLPLKGHRLVVQNAIFGRDNNTIFSGSLDNSIIAWDLNQTSSIGRKILGEGKSVTDLAIDKENQVLVAVTDADQIHIWNVSNFQPVIIPGEKAHTLKAKKVALSPDGTLLAVLDDVNLQILRIKTGVVLSSFDIKEGVQNEFQVKAMSFSIDGDRVFLAGNYNTVAVYDIAARSVQKFYGPEPDKSIDIMAIALSPDGNYLVTGNTRGDITLWNARELTYINGPIHAHGDWITGLAFSPNNNMLASASYDGLILIWDTQTLKPTGLPLEGHKNAVLTLTFSPDQKSLISGGSDKAIIWWSLETYLAVGKFNTWDSSPVTHIVIGPDNQFIISSSQAGNIYLWNMDQAQLITFACQAAGRNLTNVEWEQFFPNRPYHITCPQWP